MAKVTDQLRKAESRREREVAQSRQSVLSTILTFGSTILGAFLGRTKLTATTINKSATAIKGVGRSIEQQSEVQRAEAEIEAVKKQLADLDAQFQAEVESLGKTYDVTQEQFETIELKPTKTNINVQLTALVWFPH